jgi:hypothetical protein
MERDRQLAAEVRPAAAQAIVNRRKADGLEGQSRPGRHVPRGVRDRPASGEASSKAAARAQRRLEESAGPRPVLQIPDRWRQQGTRRIAVRKGTDANVIGK